MMEPANPTAAVVITFHPGPEVLENLAALRPQVAALIVVDNGSAESELEALRGASQRLGLTLIENGSNLGIATALNAGVRAAMAQGAEWLLLFDQDSRVPEGFVATMLGCFAASPWGDRLGILVPRYFDRRLNRPIPNLRVREGIEAAMTSGSLMRAKTFAAHGYFVDELFIDAVDYEYSLRLRRAGLVLEECSSAELSHQPGEPQRHKLLGVLNFQAANYSAQRHYYQQRNKIWVSRRYFFSFPVFCLKLFKFSAKDFVKILVAEEHKAAKCKAFLLGVLHGALNRMGRRTL